MFVIFLEFNQLFGLAMKRNLPKTTLEQWRLLDAVVESGSFALAGEQLARSQPAISYGINRLQEILGVPLLETQGRRAVITDSGKSLLQQVRPLIEELLRIEAMASKMGQGWESEVRIAMDAIFPPHVFFAALREFKKICPATNVVISEQILSGVDETLAEGRADMAICGTIPGGYIGEYLTRVEFVPVASIEHPLSALDRNLTVDDLYQHTHIVIRDSGRLNPRSDGWMGASQHWVAGSLFGSLEAVRNHIGYAWLPRHVVAGDIERRYLKQLSLEVGGARSVALHLVFKDPKNIGPGAQMLSQCLRDFVGRSIV